MTMWKCNTCGWIYDPAQGDPENGVVPGTAFEDLQDLWVCPICRSGKEVLEPDVSAPSWTFSPEKPGPDDPAQDMFPVNGNIYKERFENVFRVAQKLTSSLDIGEVLEMIRDEARTTLSQLQEVCLLVVDPEAPYYTRPLHCAVEMQRINCQLCKRGRGTVHNALGQDLRRQCAFSRTSRQAIW